MFECKHLLCMCLVFSFYSCFTPGLTVSALEPIQVYGEHCNVTVKCSEHHHMLCIEHKCSCISGRLLSNDKERCLQGHLYLGDDCEEGAQCLDRLGTHSRCHDNTCVCTQDAAPVNGVCEKTATVADPSCKEDNQCSEVFGDNSLCKNSVCGCVEGYHTTATSKLCFKDKGLTDQCDFDEECFLMSDGQDQHITCTDSVCNCAEGFSRSEANHRCLEDGVSAAYRTIPLLPTMTCLVLWAITKLRHILY